MIANFLTSRVGLAASIAMFAFLSLCAVNWMHGRTVADLNEQLIEYRTENLRLKSDNANLTASIQEQNRRIEQLAADARTSVDQARAAAIDILERARQMDGNEPLPATPEEMNQWLEQLFP